MGATYSPLGDGNAPFAGGVKDYSGGAGHQTVTDPQRPGNPGRTQVDRPVNFGARAVEWGLRADCAIEFRKDLIGRWVHEPSPIVPGYGEPRLVRMFVDKRASPDDKLDNADDGSSNHPRMPKNLLKKAIHGWVLVPKPSPYEPHYDYSYHGDPPNKQSKSGSSGGSVASVDGGAKTPDKTSTDPAGTDASDMTKDGGVPKEDGGSTSSTGGSDPAPNTDGTSSTQTFTDKDGKTWTREVYTKDGVTTPTTSWTETGS